MKPTNLTQLRSLLA